MCLYEIYDACCWKREITCSCFPRTSNRIVTVAGAPQTRRETPPLFLSISSAAVKNIFLLQTNSTNVYDNTSGWRNH